LGEVAVAVYQSSTWPRLSIKAIRSLSKYLIYLSNRVLDRLVFEVEVAGFKILAPGQVISQLTVIG
jgi:hypothetical protein